VYTGFRSLHGVDHRDTQAAVRNIADFYESWGKPEIAAEYRALLREVEEADTSG
jgi:hypothetical protein